VAELRVPEIVESPFRAHYRGLILGSALRTIQSESDLQLALGHRGRARRAERSAARLRVFAGAPDTRASRPRAETWFGDRLRVSVRLAWIAAAVLLLADVVTFGTHAWATAATDVGLVALTFVWFGVAVEDLVPPDPARPRQLELFE
jgi:hypothetical protein